MRRTRRRHALRRLPTLSEPPRRTREDTRAAVSPSAPPPDIGQGPENAQSDMLFLLLIRRVTSFHFTSPYPLPHPHTTSAPGHRKVGVSFFFRKPRMEDLPLSWNVERQGRLQRLRPPASPDPRTFRLWLRPAYRCTRRGWYAFSRPIRFGRPWGSSSLSFRVLLFIFQNDTDKTMVFTARCLGQAVLSVILYL